MRGLVLAVLVSLLVVSAVSAVPAPVSYNGKDYYRVTSTDPSEDTGNEVCGKVGLSCRGYTEESTAVCKLFNPSASTSSSVNGDLSGVYCDGSPQTGECSSKSNTCHECPDCTNSVGCDTPIGGLYREMYVECVSASVVMNCPALYAQNTKDFLNEIPSLNSELQKCPSPLPKGASFLVNNGNVVMDIGMRSGSKEQVTVTVTNKEITGITRGTNSCQQSMKVSEAVLDSILGSRDRGAAFMRAYTSGTIVMSGCTFLKKVVTTIGTPFIKFFVKRSTPPPPPPTPPANCGQIGEQCNNRGCFSGVCGAPRERIDGRWMYANYRCLDSTTDYNTYCVARGGAPAPWSCYIGNVYQCK